MADAISYIVDEWKHDTEIAGAHNRIVVPVISEVTVACPFWSEFIAGSVICLEAARQGEVLKSANVLLCAFMAHDLSWVLRAVRAAEFAEAINASQVVLTEQRVRESTPKPISCGIPKLLRSAWFCMRSSFSADP